MLVISERVNGLFSAVGKAIDRRDGKWIQGHALHQLDCGATVLDVNTGPGREDGPAAMDWLVRTIQDVTEATLCIDTPGLKTMTAGLKAAKNPVIMNSTTAERRRMEALFPLCREHGAEIICLTMDEKGIPNDAETRTELAMTMVTVAMEHEIMPDRLLLDPLVLPIKAAQDQGMKVVKVHRDVPVPERAAHPHRGRPEQRFQRLQGQAVGEPHLPGHVARSRFECGHPRPGGPNAHGDGEDRPGASQREVVL